VLLTEPAEFASHLARHARHGYWRPHSFPLYIPRT
jgi:hypothetical protein